MFMDATDIISRRTLSESLADLHRKSTSRRIDSEIVLDKCVQAWHPRVMETLILVYGLARGETERYMETLLASRCRSQADVEKVKAAAARDGWHSFRVAVSDGSAPDFARAVGVRGKAGRHGA